MTETIDLLSESWKKWLVFGWLKRADNEATQFSRQIFSKLLGKWLIATQKYYNLYSNISPSSLNVVVIFAPQCAGTFDSLKLAMSATSRAAAIPNEDDSDFQRKRREILAEAQGDVSLTQHKFKVGGSKYAPLSFFYFLSTRVKIILLLANGFPTYTVV